MSAGPAAAFVLASTNKGKLAEYRELLSGLRIRLAELPAGGEVPEETGATFVENALIKARHAARRNGCAALADDSGLCVDALDGAPGVISARYAGPGATDQDNIDRLLSELADVEDARRTAAFHCVIVAVSSAADPAPVIATGCWLGTITRAPRGRLGFGYDPVFFDPASGCTAAELDPGQKNRVSHRGRASKELLRLLALRSLADRRGS